VPIERAMASKLRLQVLLPVAVLGILGLGVGALATTRGAPATNDADAIAARIAAKQKAKGPGETGAADAQWAKEANAWCAKVNATIFALGEPTTIAEVEPALKGIVRIQESAVASFPKLRWPPGEKRAVLRLRSTLAGSTSAARSALAAFRSRDLDALERSIRRWDKSDHEWDRRMRRLGAETCAQAVSGPMSSESTANLTTQQALKSALFHHRVVVVLFYAPGDDYDTIQTRETRAGALAAHAGFLALNVTKNQQVAALAAQYEVREAPATFVFTRGPRVAYRVAGYMDRAAIAQAVANALS
jgi:hypothetical protein